MDRGWLFLTRQLRRIVVLGLLGGLYWATVLPDPASIPDDTVVSRFQFTAFSLPPAEFDKAKLVRDVHPSLDRISSWISAVGASVALNDLDGDGLPNDVCYVDPRTDQVMVAPIPWTERRFEPFVLSAEGLHFDRERMAPMGCLPGDFNEDGLVDILVYYWGRPPAAFLRRHASPDLGLSADSYYPRDAGNPVERWYTNAATVADLDGDGHGDLIIGNYFQDDAEILNSRGTTRQQMQQSMSRAYNGGRNRLLRWEAASGGGAPDVTFREVPDVLGRDVEKGWTLAVGAADLDGDLLPEIYFANDFGPDRLLHNRSTPGRLQFELLKGVKTLRVPNSKVLGGDSFKGMGVDFGDLNNDGILDIYVSNITSNYALHESQFLFLSQGTPAVMRRGIAPYVDCSEALGLSRSGWAWEARLADFDNDGVLEALQATGFIKGQTDRWPELHELAMGNDQLLSNPRNWPLFGPGDDLSGHEPNAFFVRDQNGRYVDVASRLGLDRPQVSRGIATADVDGDGDLDFAVANQWEDSYVYRNENPGAGCSLILRPLLPRYLPSESASSVHAGAVRIPETRLALGASAAVETPDGRKLIAQVDGGNGHSGARSPEIHFGLGKVSPRTFIRVNLRWRDAGRHVHEENLRLPPGWHTIVLGCSGERLNSNE